MKTVKISAEFQNLSQRNFKKSCEFFFFFFKVTRFTLKENLRVRFSPSPDLEFESWVLNLGNGYLPTVSPYPSQFGIDLIKIPPQILSPAADLIAFVDEIYPTLNASTPTMPTDRIIVTPLNKDVHRINSIGLHKLSSIHPTYFYSIDNIEEEANHEKYPTDYLNLLTPNSLPLHALALKPFAIVILLRTLSQEKGLCNGTRLRVSPKKILPPSFLY